MFTAAIITGGGRFLLRERTGIPVGRFGTGPTNLVGRERPPFEGARSNLSYRTWVNFFWTGNDGLFSKHVSVGEELVYYPSR